MIEIVLDELFKVEVYRFNFDTQNVQQNFKTVNLFIYDKIFRIEKNDKTLRLEIGCLLFGKCKTKKFDTRMLINYNTYIDRNNNAFSGGNSRSKKNSNESEFNVVHIISRC